MLLQVCDEQQAEPEVFSLAVSYLDRFIKLCPQLKKTQLQLSAATCMLIASKLKETIPISAEKLVIYTDHSVTREDMMVGYKLYY